MSPLLGGWLVRVSFHVPIKLPSEVVPIYVLAVARFWTVGLAGPGATGTHPAMQQQSYLERKSADCQPSVLTMWTTALPCLLPLLLVSILLFFFNRNTIIPIHSNMEEIIHKIFHSHWTITTKIKFLYRLNLNLLFSVACIKVFYSCFKKPTKTVETKLKSKEIIKWKKHK